MPMRQQIVDAAIAKVRRADRIAVAAGCQRTRQQLVKVAPDIRDLVSAEYLNSCQIAVAIEALDFRRRQPLRMLNL
jgi:hypothetical protein